MMNKKFLNVDMVSGKFKVNASSRIIGVKYNKNELNYIVEYYESPFTDELDIYQVMDIYFKDEDFDADNYLGYTFYGKYWDRIQNDYFILLAKQIDRIKNK